MKQQGCEIEAIGITYQVPLHGRHFFRPNLSGQTTPSPSSSPSSPSSSSGFTRTVLNQVNCTAKPWEMLAVVGPSGAGKSSLLEILAGKLTPQNGTVLINNAPMKNADFNRISGYVTQKDDLFPLLTVEETLRFTAELRLKLPAAEIEARVRGLIGELGLGHVAAARVGNGGTVRGISGGERRRVSIGVEVIHDPRVLILDEPTSGLDSTSALQIVDMLKTMAETRGRTVILSIHQPGFRIVKLFDSILLLANGSVVHHGSVDQLGSTLGLMGLELPPRCNIVEFAIDSLEKLSLITSQQHQQQQTPQQMSLPHRKRKTLQQLFQQSKVMDIEDAALIQPELEPYTYANSRFKEILILSHRFSKLVFRTKELFACRTLQMLVSGLVLGSIFYQLPEDLEGAVERVGLFAFILTFLLSCTTDALPVFLQERSILLKETWAGSYRVSSYVFATSLVYLPFLLVLALLFSLPVYWLVGLNPSFPAFLHFLLLIWLILYTANSVTVCFSALVPNFIVGNSVISGIMGSFFLFSGYFISKKEIPAYWAPMHYVSLFKYPYEGFVVNEFSGPAADRCLEAIFGACVVRGKDVLKEQGLGEEGEGESRWVNVGIIVGFIVLYRFVSYVILRCKCAR